MIKAIELRIGNWVYKDYNKEEVGQLKAIHEGEMAFEPIELSPEILVVGQFEI